jgi:hypothetical protein
MSRSSSSDDGDVSGKAKIDDMTNKNDREGEDGNTENMTTRRRRRAERFSSKKTATLITASFAVVCASFIILAIRRQVMRRGEDKGKGRKSPSSEVDAKGRPVPQSLIEDKRKLLFGTSRYIWHIHKHVAMGLFARTAPGQQQQASSEIAAGPMVTTIDPNNRCTWIIVVYRESCNPCKESLPYFKQECLAIHKRRMSKRGTPEASDDLVVAGAIEERQLPHDFPVDFFPMYLVMTRAGEGAKFTKLMLNANQIGAVFAAATGTRSKIGDSA